MYNNAAVTIQGNRVSMSETVDPGYEHLLYFFEGELNANGTILTGYWYGHGQQAATNTYYKVR
jgi:hypothetical protein